MNKQMKTLLFALGLTTTGLALSSCGREDDLSISYESSINNVKDDTCMDEILFKMEENHEMIQNINILENCLKLSKKLYELDLSDDIDKIDDNKKYEIYSNDVLFEKIKEFEDLREKESNDHSEKYIEMAKTLKCNEGFINEYIYNYGYDTVIDFSLKQVKSKILDAYGLDYTEYNKFTVDRNKSNNDDGPMPITIYYDDETGEKKYLEIKNFLFEESMLTKIVNNVYKCQNKNETKELYSDKFNIAEYNLDRNDILNEAIKTLKEGLYATYKIDDDKIVQVENGSDIKTKFNEKNKVLSK